jgi:hypothetical protein
MCSSSVATCMDLLDSLVHSLVYQDCLACRDTIARLLRCAASSGTGWLFNFHYVFCLSNRRNESICLFSVFLSYSLFGPICFVWFQLLDCIWDIQKYSVKLCIYCDSKSQVSGTNVYGTAIAWTKLVPTAAIWLFIYHSFSYEVHNFFSLHCLTKVIH